jgi:hypothetical protein
MVAETTEWPMVDIYDVGGRPWKIANPGSNFEGDRF